MRQELQLWQMPITWSFKFTPITWYTNWYPGGGGAALWSLSLLPLDGQITLSAGLGGYVSDVNSATLTTPINLSARRYWLVFYPELTYSAGGQYGRYVADTTNGYAAR